MDVPPRERLSAESWARAALDALATGGLAAVAVEPVAARLGTTKGSFYWHFPGRDALVDATLELWQRLHTDAVIADLDRVADPADRLQALVTRTVLHAGSDDPVVALLRDADDPRVRAVLRTVAQRRVRYVRELLEELGVPPDDAARRATLAYSTYLGWWHLRTVSPELAPEASAAHGYADLLRAMLFPRSAG